LWHSVSLRNRFVRLTARLAFVKSGFSMTVALAPHLLDLSDHRLTKDLLRNRFPWRDRLHRRVQRRSTSQDLKTVTDRRHPKHQQVAIMIGALHRAGAWANFAGLNDAATVYVPASKIAPA